MCCRRGIFFGRIRDKRATETLLEIDIIVERLNGLKTHNFNVSITKTCIESVYKGAVLITNRHI